MVWVSRNQSLHRHFVEETEPHLLTAGQAQVDPPEVS